MANTDKFTGKATVYEHYRPDYPEALIRDLITDHHLNGSSLIADIGAGTGIFTRQLLEHRLHVTAVEPNPDMRHTAETLLSGQPRFHSVAAPAEQTTLAPESIDLITVAQAFHWFDTRRFLAECRRILKPGGAVVLIWNNRAAEAPLIRETEAVCRRFCPDYNGFSGGTHQDDARFRSFFRDDRYTLKTYDHPLRYDLDRFIGRHLSASYAPRQDQPNYRPFVDALTEIFHHYAGDARQVDFPNRARSYSGHV